MTEIIFFWDPCLIPPTLAFILTRKSMLIAVAGTKRDRFYIYIKLILLAPACTVVQQTDNGCNNYTINNTNTNDKVYKIDIAYKIYNMYRILT